MAKARKTKAKNQVQVLINKISSTPQVQKALGEVQKIADDLKTKAQNLNINMKLTPETQHKIQEALKSYHMIASKVATTEKEVEAEFDKLMKKFKSKQSQIEKNLDTYKKKAVTQKQKLQKMFKKAQKKTTKKAAAPKTTKKVAKKATKKTA